MSRITVELKDIAKVVNGSTPSTRKPGYYDGDIIWITPKDLSNQKQRFIYKGERSITIEGYNSCSTTLVPKGSILLSSRAPIGLLAIAGIELCTNQGFKNIISNAKFIDNLFLFYYLKIKVEELNNLGSGTTFMELSKTSIENFKLEIPASIQTQKAIAKVLSDLDAKIELNNKINRELKAMAKTLYDYWFVQFDFPFDFAQGKPNEQGKPYKSSGGKMVYNEELKREIPEGWEVKFLVDLTEKIGDGIHGTPQYVEDSAYRFINGNNLKDGFIKFDKETKKVSQTEYERHFINLNKNSILLSINGTLGNLAVFTNEKVMLGKSSAYINCKEKHRAFCYQFLKQDNIQKTFWLIATGSTIKNLSLASLKNLKLVYPSLEIIKQFDIIIKPIDNKRENIFKQNQQLTTLRDWLLPMLMNGQVTLRQAQGDKLSSRTERSRSMAAEPSVEYGKG